MDTEIMYMMQQLPENKRMEFQMNFSGQKKDPTTALLLCFFLGGIGVHEFYLGNTGRGILMACFFWTFVPAIIAFVQLFLITGRVKEMNKTAAQQIIMMMGK